MGHFQMRMLYAHCNPRSNSLLDGGNPHKGFLKGKTVTLWSIFTSLPYGAPPFISISLSLEEVDANGRIHLSGLNKARFCWDVFSVYVIFISYTSSLYLSALYVK